MATSLAYSPDMILLSALENELRGLARREGDDLGAWAREVANHLGLVHGAQAVDSQAVLAVAARALGQIMRSDNWQFLLEDALNRPRVFARTLGIMINGHFTPARHAVRQ